MLSNNMQAVILVRGKRRRLFHYVTFFLKPLISTRDMNGAITKKEICTSMKNGGCQ